MLLMLTLGESGLNPRSPPMTTRINGIKSRSVGTSITVKSVKTVDGLSEKWLSWQSKCQKVLKVSLMSVRPELSMLQN